MSDEALPAGALIPLGGSLPMAATSQGHAGTQLMTPESRRVIAEVQGAIFVAQQFPRDRLRAMDRILQECMEPALAEDALYSFSRGGQDIEGPSIDLLEVIAQNWGNIKFGWKEVSRGNGVSQIEAYAWDMENNVYHPAGPFEVRHVRDTKYGKKPVTEERDIYELCANMASRRMRSCMERVIPRYVISRAVDQIKKTLQSNVDVTPDSIAKLVAAFDKLGVSRAQIEKRILRHVDAITAPQVVHLRTIYKSIAEGLSTTEQWFPALPSQMPQTGDKLEAFEQAKPPAAEEVDPETGEVTSADATKRDQSKVDVTKYLTELRGTSPLKSRHKDWGKWSALLAEFAGQVEDPTALVALFTDELRFLADNRTKDYETIMALVQA